MKKIITSIVILIVLSISYFVFQVSKFDANFTKLKENATSYIIEKGSLPSNQNELSSFELSNNLIPVTDYFNSIIFEGSPNKVTIRASAYFSSGTHSFSLHEELSPKAPVGN